MARPDGRRNARRVPLFYYLLQWYVIHPLAVLAALARGLPVAWLFSDTFLRIRAAGVAAQFAGDLRRFGRRLSFSCTSPAAGSQA